MLSITICAPFPHLGALCRVRSPRLPASPAQLPRPPSPCLLFSLTSHQHNNSYHTRIAILPTLVTIPSRLLPAHSSLPARSPLPLAGLDPSTPRRPPETSPTLPRSFPSTMLISAITAIAALGAQVVNAATAEEWRTRTIYQCASPLLHSLTPESLRTALRLRRIQRRPAPTPFPSSAIQQSRRGVEAPGCLSSTSLTTSKAWALTQFGSRPLVVRISFSVTAPGPKGRRAQPRHIG